MGNVHLKSHDYESMVHFIQDSDKFLRQLVISGNIFVEVTNRFYKDNAYVKDLEKFLHAKKVFQSDIEQMKNQLDFIQGAFYGVEQDSES